MSRRNQVLICLILCETMGLGVILLMEARRPVPVRPPWELLDSIAAAQMREIHTRVVTERSSDAYHELGESCLAAGLFKYASESFQNAAYLDPQRVDSRHALGFCLERMGRIEEALPWLRGTLGQVSQGVAAQKYQLGRCHLRMEQLDLAEQAFAESGTDNATFHLASIMLEDGRGPAAIQALDRALQDSPDVERLVQLRARAAEAVGDLPGSRLWRLRDEPANTNLRLTYSDQVTGHIMPRYGAAHTLVNCYHFEKMDERASAINCLLEFIKQARTDVNLTRIEHGEHVAGLLLKANDWQQALLILDELAAEGHNTSATLELRGDACESQGDLVSANDCWSRAAHMRPTSGLLQKLADSARGRGEVDVAQQLQFEATLRRGTEMYRAGQIDDAAAVFRRLLDQPDQIDTRQYLAGISLARILILQGKYQAARIELAACLAFNSSEPAGQRLLQDLNIIESAPKPVLRHVQEVSSGLAIRPSLEPTAP